METNKIILGDAYKLIKEIPDKSIDLIITDPPYLIESTRAGGNSELALSIQHMNDELQNNNLVVSINEDILNEMVRVMKKINIYIWCNHKQIPMYLNYFVNKLKCSFDIIVWHKTNAAPLFCNKYLTDKEYCLYFRKGAYCNPQTYEEATTVYNMPINIDDKKLYGHPTIKPLSIIKNLIKNSSNENDIVFDPFVGSGTTCEASKLLNRKYIGFEINEKYYKIAVDRLNGINQKGEMNLFETDFEKLEQMNLFDSKE